MAKVAIPWAFHAPSAPGGAWALPGPRRFGPPLPQALAHQHLVGPGVRGRARAARTLVRAAEAEKKTSWRKWSTFWACFFGYSICYFTRQSLSYTAPVLRQAMGWKGLAEIGKLQSLFPLAYGSSRFLGGLLGDLLSPKRVFALGLCVCSLLNIAFGLSSTLPQFAFFWLLNGCFQGLAAPPCVKMITNWFDPKERGFWWSVWHASINLGGFLCPFFAGGLAGMYGWRYGMLGCGFLGLFTVVLCYLAMSDGPKSMAQSAKKEASKTEADVSLMEGIILNPVQWALGLAYMLVYVWRAQSCFECFLSHHDRHCMSWNGIICLSIQMVFN